MLYVIGLLTILLMGVGAWLGSPQGKGWLSEKRVALQLGKLPPAQYTVLHDVLLPHDGSTTQIDHVILSPFGVFVIETKNYDGWIFGNARQSQWTQVLGRRKFRFQNPLHQNYRHVRCLAELTQVQPEMIHSLVVFTQRSTFKTQMPAHVIKTSDLLRTVQGFSQPLLTESQLKAVAAAISAAAIASTFASRRQHVQDLKKRHADRPK